MLLRPKRFLTFLLIVAAPLILFSSVGFLYAISSLRESIRGELQALLSSTKLDIDSAVHERQRELIAVAKSRALMDVFTTRQSSSASEAFDNHLPGNIGEQIKAQEYCLDVISPLITDRGFSSIAALTPNRLPLFWYESDVTSGLPAAVSREGNFGEPFEDPLDFSSLKHGQTSCVTTIKPELGPILRCVTPVSGGQTIIGAVTGDIKLDKVVGDVARRVGPRDSSAPNGNANRVFVLDPSGYIIYHENDAVRLQNVKDSLPELMPIANAMLAGPPGEQFYDTNEGEQMLAAYTQCEAGLSLALIRNYTAASAGARRWGWSTLAIAAAVGLGLAILLTIIYQRKEQSLERVTEGVSAIAKGELDLHIDAHSRDDIRQLAEGVNLVTDRLREQLAREAEVRQLGSFLRFSAMLTHDLKNAIGGLSLLVQNMEQHYSDDAFRIEAMAELRRETETLNRLVERISSPVNTLSGEYKRPQSVELTMLIKGVVKKQTVSVHQLRMELPASLMARVDRERIERVVENLVLNALEAMNNKPGVLTITAGQQDVERVFFSISDTGVGMTERFLEQKVFRPFATTKEKGMGLGLYTCREVVLAHGGTIEVTSKPSAGTTFRVVLPSAATE
ncbi:MAG TPA: ATP-binding protein [Pyrinomonadaceae bacterium]|nr:ATP-binding protein [Pyrinomonadaceae bacterium]